MSAKNIFIVLVLSLATVVVAFNFAIYNPAEEERLLLQKQLNKTVQKFKNASRAKKDLENIRERIDIENDRLSEIKKKFIEKNDLSNITLQIRERTNQHHLKLLEFTPVFKFYFADTSKSPVKSLPFSVIVTGKFIDIGKFVESWNDFDFYIIPEEIQIEKLNNKSNNLEAMIVGRFYAWAKDQDKK
ncbi:MAG: hypothetical protein D8M58_03145 [Calditrichaeota bacterium]|nr:MAG: hypothetical protein DWQ03_03935 [Calditrichota bacterium]MBL1204362.1 hypothetical protein [Calditrichota bacterium]NOG44191.1 type 4a pilus biogenesis protein PilO [Calditrichota bacterium]